MGLLSRDSKKVRSAHTSDGTCGQERARYRRDIEQMVRDRMKGGHSIFPGLCLAPELQKVGNQNGLHLRLPASVRFGARNRRERFTAVSRFRKSDLVSNRETRLSYHG